MDTERTPSNAAVASSMPAAVASEFEEAIALAKRFNAEVVRPMYLAIDRKVLADNDYLPEEFVAKAVERLGFRPRVSLSAGVRATLDWYLQARWL